MLQELHRPLVENVLKKSTVLNDSLVTYTGIVLAYFRVYDITYSLIKCSRDSIVHFKHNMSSCYVGYFLCLSSL